MLQYLLELNNLTGICRYLGSVIKEPFTEGPVPKGPCDKRAGDKMPPLRSTIIIMIYLSNVVK